MNNPRQAVPPNDTQIPLLRSTPDTIVWGIIPATVPPVLRISSGQVLRIDTVSHGGLRGSEGPVAFFGAAGIAPDRVLQDAVDIHRHKTPAGSSGVHVLTGPVHVEGAQPGDMLEVRILDIEFRVPYGVNSTGPGYGVLPDLVPSREQRVIKLDLERKVALFSEDVEVPLAPFMGILAVAPPIELAPVSTKPPGRWGGNMDLKQLQVGATLYLPVINEGALFYAGDGHAVQGDGEVDGTAIEISLTPTLQFNLHKGMGRDMKWPRAEDAAHHYVLAMHTNLDEALKGAVAEAIAFLQGRAALSAAEAYALASIAVDFRVGEAVNEVKMVYGVIPKELFKRHTPYWRNA
jgi:acetamidase/formamidase